MLASLEKGVACRLIWLASHSSQSSTTFTV
jgi:hypothetical protein